MYGYAGSSATASTLTPFTSPPPTTNPAGAGSQAAAVAQSFMSSGSRVIDAIPQALQGLAASAAADPPSAQALSDLLSAISAALTLLAIPVGTTSIGSSATSISAAFTGVGTNFRGFSINADRDFAQRQGARTPAMGRAPPTCRTGSSTARAASAHRRTRYRHPYGRRAWARQTPSADCRCRRLGRWRRPRSARSPTRCRSPAPRPPPRSAGVPATCSAAWASPVRPGGAVGSTASLGRGDQRTRTTPRAKPEAAATAAERGGDRDRDRIAGARQRAQSLLAKLADSGLMTTEEVTEQKRRAWPWAERQSPRSRLSIAGCGTGRCGCESGRLRDPAASADRWRPSPRCGWPSGSAYRIPSCW